MEELGWGGLVVNVGFVEPGREVSIFGLKRLKKKKEKGKEIEEDYKKGKERM